MTVASARPLPDRSGIATAPEILRVEDLHVVYDTMILLTRLNGVQFALTFVAALPGLWLVWSMRARIGAVEQAQAK